MTYKPKHHWNYRVVTKLITGKQGIDLSDMRNNEKLQDKRLFSIVEVYYRDGNPDSYTESKSLLYDVESKKALKWIHKKIKKAFNKKILDLDNWPAVWKSSENN